MEQASFKVYGYRWIVLLAVMFVVAINQLLWITFLFDIDSWGRARRENDKDHIKSFINN